MFAKTLIFRRKFASRSNAPKMTLHLHNFAFLPRLAYLCFQVLFLRAESGHNQNISVFFQPFAQILKQLCTEELDEVGQAPLVFHEKTLKSMCWNCLFSTIPYYLLNATGVFGFITFFVFAFASNKRSC